ncbi:hypothetical protein HUE56_09760 [Azospirillum oryzae]|uniref:CopL family metal-binding regulatory protein n=1 Tax=Azospirillum oryzae TaxID=286727 RepID=A0A6N1AH91_9PROT|nr:hypothetical protein [Azospirillum oryzae]KAA0585946.1 hypothetical protein FZ938_22680 [Azospirillum oryzae]QKS50823.1 hypothetical protein HUE56_09760 [Azospirillum oryzae]
MWRGVWSTVRRVVVSLLMLATLLVYAVPSHASLLPHRHSPAPHEHALAATQDGAVAAVADHEHRQDSCGDLGVLGDDACCSVAQCATMHGGLPTDAVAAFVPPLDRAAYLPALATPEGIDSDPALRPPL